MNVIFVLILFILLNLIDLCYVLVLLFMTEYNYKELISFVKILRIVKRESNGRIKGFLSIQLFVLGFMDLLLIYLSVVLVIKLF